MPAVELREFRREVGHHEKRGIYLLDEFAVRFGLVADALPFGIVLEDFPVGGGRLAARMRKDVDEGLAF